jgi:hypothetical protein
MMSERHENHDDLSDLQAESDMKTMSSLVYHPR